MPFSIEINLRTSSDLNPNSLPPMNSALHGLFLNCMNYGDSQIARKLHDSNGIRPYTISPLTINDVGIENTARFRITLLDDNLWTVLERGLLQCQDIRLFQWEFTVNELHLIKQDSFEHLAVANADASNIILQFDSPTFFKASGKELPLLDPNMIFMSLFNRWNAFAPENLQFNSEWIDNSSIAILYSRSEQFPQRKQYGRVSKVGFVGKIEYSLQPRIRLRPSAENDSGRQIANALASYAYYCGIGSNTTFGFGQTKRLEKWMDTRFFISYSSKDGFVAERISELLQKSGYATWLDKKDIVIGQPILDRVGKGIEVESDFVIILLSKNSTNSEWCRLELRMAYQKEMALKRIVVLPIRIDDVDVPAEVQTKKYFQFSPRSEMSGEALISEIKWLLKSQGF